jgi:hypothetical protein
VLVFTGASLTSASERDPDAQACHIGCWTRLNDGIHEWVRLGVFFCNEGSAPWPRRPKIPSDESGVLRLHVGWLVMLIGDGLMHVGLMACKHDHQNS